MKKELKSIQQFCLIQLQILEEREKSLRKEILNCKIQKEYINSLVTELEVPPTLLALAPLYKEDGD